MTDIALCSDCFRDQGLRLDAERIGIDENSPCPTCGSQSSRKLNKELIAALAHQFFVRGTLHRSEYGAAPRVQFNEHQSTSIRTSPWRETDLRRLSARFKSGPPRHRGSLHSDRSKKVNEDDCGDSCSPVTGDSVLPTIASVPTMRTAREGEQHAGNGSALRSREEPAKTPPTD